MCVCVPWPSHRIGRLRGVLNRWWPVHPWWVMSPQPRLSAHPLIVGDREAKQHHATSQHTGHHTYVSILCVYTQCYRPCYIIPTLRYYTAQKITPCSYSACYYCVMRLLNSTVATSARVLCSEFVTGSKGQNWQFQAASDWRTDVPRSQPRPIKQEYSTWIFPTISLQWKSKSNHLWYS